MHSHNAVLINVLTMFCNSYYFYGMCKIEPCRFQSISLKVTSRKISQLAHTGTFSEMLTSVDCTHESNYIKLNVTE